MPFKRFFLSWPFLGGILSLKFICIFEISEKFSIFMSGVNLKISTETKSIFGKTAQI
jgi:hypothetical protein